MLLLLEPQLIEFVLLFTFFVQVKRRLRRYELRLQELIDLAQHSREVFFVAVNVNVSLRATPQQGGLYILLHILEVLFLAIKAIELVEFGGLRMFKLRMFKFILDIDLLLEG